MYSTTSDKYLRVIYDTESTIPTRDILVASRNDYTIANDTLFPDASSPFRGMPGRDLAAEGSLRPTFVIGNMIFQICVSNYTESMMSFPNASANVTLFHHGMLTQGGQEDRRTRYKLAGISMVVVREELSNLRTFIEFREFVSGVRFEFAARRYAYNAMYRFLQRKRRALFYQFAMITRKLGRDGIRMTKCAAMLDLLWRHLLPPARWKIEFSTSCHTFIEQPKKH
mmetsp:Transcript_79454/g.212993  ORF Transcript_79454/g.212993 Transcript_79454/m.212993 type:complete len:226 (+) Transcript_79454:40-717(+)